MALTIQAVVSLDTRMFSAGIRGLEASINQFAGLAVMQFGGVAQQIASMWGAFGPVGGAMTALSNVIQVGADYEQQMARVASYTGAAGEEMEKLADVGGNLAETLGFSLKQVGESMASLALAGVEVSDMADVLEPSLKLAGATLADANQTAEAITSTLKVFQMEMSSAKHVADMFAGAIASSPLDMQRLTDAMKYAGATGAAYGMQMEQVVSEIAAFHQVGLRGQLAGTAFRGALLEMAAAAAEAKGQVGAALQGWVPATEGLTGAVRRLNAAGVDAADVIQELGKRAGPGVAALMKFGADSMDDLTAKVAKAADVDKMYSIQIETLAGQFKLLKGEVANLAREVFEKLAPAFQNSLAVLRGWTDALKTIGSAIGTVVGGISSQLIPALVQLGGTMAIINGSARLLSGFGLLAGGTTIGGILSQSRGAAEAKQQLAALNAERQQILHNLANPNQQASAQIAELRRQQAALNNAMYQTRLAGPQVMGNTMYTKTMAGLQKEFAGTQKAIDAQMKAVNSSISAQNKLLAENTVAMGQARAAAGAFGLGVSGATLAFSAFAAALAGLSAGRFIANMQVAGHSVEDWLAGAMSGTGAGFYDTLPTALTQVQADIKEWKEKGAEAAQTFIAGMADSAEWAERFGNVTSEVTKKAKEMADELDGIFGGRDVFGVATGGMFAEIDGVAKEIKDVFAGSGGELFGIQASQLQTAISNVGKDAAALKDSIADKEQKYVESLRQEKELQEQIAMLEGKVSEREDYIQNDRYARIWNHLREQAQYEIDTYNEKIAAIRKTLEERHKETEAAKNAASEELARQSEIIASLNVVRDRLSQVRIEVENTKRLNEQMDASWNDFVADTEAAQVKESLTEISNAFAETGLSMDAARSGIKALGNGLVPFVQMAQNAGVSVKSIGSNLQWMVQNQDSARISLVALGIEEQKTVGFMVKYGAQCFEVARRMKQLGETEDEAALAILGTGNATEKASDAIKDLAENESVVNRFATMSGSRLQRLKDNVISLFDAFKNANMNPGQIDLSWIRDLGSMQRLPNLSGVKSWVEKFREFVTGVFAASLRGLNIDLKWMQPLAAFKMPDLGDVKGWTRDFGRWTDSIAAKQATLDSFADSMQKLNGAMVGVGNASIEIGFRDADVLNRIEGHLATLASLKGIVWA